MFYDENKKSMRRKYAKMERAKRKGAKRNRKAI